MAEMPKKARHRKLLSRKNMEDNAIVNLPVYTEREQFVGHVIGFEIDVEQHAITQYLVSKHKLVENLLQPILRTAPLRIASQQVRSITDEKMVVADTAVPSEQAETESSVRRAEPAEAASPLAASLEETH